MIEQNGLGKRRKSGHEVIYFLKKIYFKKIN
jgi:hypothetical protein